jgi:hypothetical protein
MAFDVAGLGGTFAAGFLGGAQSAQKERELIANQRERDYLKTYTELVQSGEWEPVDTKKGVPDGGILRVGNIGLLKQRQRQQSMEEQLRLEKLLGEVTAQRNRPLPSRTRSTLVDADGEPMVADRHQEFVNGEWVDVEVVPRLKEQRSLVEYVLPSGEYVHVPSNVPPPPGSRRVPQVLSGERLDMYRNEVSAFEAEANARIAVDKAKKLYGSSLLAMKDSPEQFAKDKVEEYAIVVGEAAKWTAIAAEQKKGSSPVEVERAGEYAKREAEAQVRAKFIREKELTRGKETSSIKNIISKLSTIYDKQQAKQAEIWLKKADELIAKREKKRASKLDRKLFDIIEEEE